MMRLKYIWSAMTMSVLLSGVLFTACKEDEYHKIDDLFQPRYVLEEPEVKSNSIALVWYKVNEAVSYTIEFHLDNYFCLGGNNRALYFHGRYTVWDYLLYSCACQCCECYQ